MSSLFISHLAMPMYLKMMQCWFSVRHSRKTKIKLESLDRIDELIYYIVRNTSYNPARTVGRK